jgi:hypothetical protein
MVYAPYLVGQMSQRGIALVMYTVIAPQSLESGIMYITMLSAISFIAFHKKGKIDAAASRLRVIMTLRFS